ncbi:MAG: M24 family metallopeptidase [Solirubrobacterales bacterium]
MSASTDRHPFLRPAWEYRPGADVDREPPAGLLAVQEIAIQVAEATVGAVAPGRTEVELEVAAAEKMRELGAAGIWTITNVGAGEGGLECFPTATATDREVGAADVVTIDVHPISQTGFWGDCTRTAVLGTDPGLSESLAELEDIHVRTLGACRPGMPAQELFGHCAELLRAADFELLDALGNIGHSLAAGAAYVDGFIDAANATPMWAAWAIEPFVGRDGRGYKVEDVVWFGRDACTVVGR